MTWIFCIHNTNPNKVAPCPLSNRGEKSWKPKNKKIRNVAFWFLLSQCRFGNHRSGGVLLPQGLCGTVDSHWSSRVVRFLERQKIWYMRGRILHMSFSRKKMKYDTCERVVCFFDRRLIFASKSLVLWWLQQTAIDCNRLQQTVTERRLIFASKRLVFRWERGLHFLRRPRHFPASDLSICISIYPCIYVCMCLSIYVSMCVCVYWCIHVSMHRRVYLCIYASIYLSICINTYKLSCRHTD